jgi:hypothetical protein
VTLCFKKGLWTGSEERKHRGTKGTERDSLPSLKLCALCDSVFQKGTLDCTQGTEIQRFQNKRYAERP